MLYKADQKKSAKHGFSMLEIVISIAILALIVTLSLVSFFALNRRSELNSSASIIKSVLSEARSKTLAGYSGTRYGVHFASTSVTIFLGDTYNAGAGTNVTTSIYQNTTVSNVAVSGGGVNIIFNRLTGETSQPGTVTLTGPGGATKTLTIYGTGIVE